MKKALLLAVVMLSTTVAIPAFAHDRTNDDHRPTRAELARKKAARIDAAREARQIRRAHRHARRHLRRDVNRDIRRNIDRPTDRRF